MILLLENLKHRLKIMSLGNTNQVKKLVGIEIILAVLVIAGLLFVTSQLTEEAPIEQFGLQEQTQSSNLEIPKGFYAFVMPSSTTNTPTLYLYSFADKKTIPTGIAVRNWGGHLSSPKFDGVLYIEDITHDLYWLSYKDMSKHLLVKKEDPTHFDFIIRSVWSPSGEKAILQKHSYPEYEQEHVLFNKSNLSIQESIPGALQFVNDDALLVASGQNYGNIGIYSIKSGIVESEINAQLHQGRSQFTLSADAKKWAFLFFPHYPYIHEAKIIIADFLQLEGATIPSGEFANYQGPVISPEGTKVVFEHSPYQNSQKMEIIIYDFQKKISKTIPLQAERLNIKQWINDSQFLLEEYFLGVPAKSYVINADTGIVQDVIDYASLSKQF